WCRRRAWRRHRHSCSRERRRPWPQTTEKRSSTRRHDRVALARVRLDGIAAERRDDIDGGPDLLDAEAVAGEDRLVAAGVQVREAVGEFDLLAVERERAVGGLCRPKSLRQ